MWLRASVVMIVTLSAVVVQAVDPAVSAMYGKGVHAYYDGSYQQSFESLSRVVAIGTSDPRVYYFRGLAALQLGRRDEAVADFTKGAELEAEGWSMRTVSRSLERIQGGDRLLLERSRQGARLALAQQMAADDGGVARAPRVLGGLRYSGIGGTARSPQKAAEDSGSAAKPVDPPPASSKPSVAETDSASPPEGEMASEAEAENKDPFSDDPFADEKEAPKKAPSGENKDDTPSDPFSPSNDDPFNFAPNRGGASDT